ncbi:transposase [Streptomyces sp. NPDC094048]|uniref:transposase n=1 Tax=Streptomyces sp. NPDC094048 TaxID=3155207 RepID=UPI003316A75D
MTTVQISEVVERLVADGQWKPGDPEVLVVLDAGYDAPRIARLLAGLPAEILGRLRSDRVMRRTGAGTGLRPQGRPATQARRRRRLRRSQYLGHRTGPARPEFSGRAGCRTARLRAPVRGLLAAERLTALDPGLDPGELPLGCRQLPGARSQGVPGRRSPS